MTIINIETDYDGSNVPRSSLPGIQYAKRLRRKGVKDPIVFTSFLSLDYVLGQTGTDLLTTMAHGFVRLPCTNEDIEIVCKDLNPLSDVQLKDIVRNYCDARGIFSTIFHAFKGKLRSIVFSTHVDISIKLKEIETLFHATVYELKREFAGNTELITNFEKLLYRTQVPNEDITIWSINILEKAEQAFYDYIPIAEDNIQEGNRLAKPWKVLILDDEPASLTHLTNELNLRGIVYKIVGTVKDAQNEICNDQFNHYTVAISDYRLLEPIDGCSKSRLQKEQGYDFLIWLKKQFRFTASVALSGLGRSFLMESFRLENVDVKVFSKNELDRGVKIFVDDLEYLGEKNFEVVCNQPQQTDWQTLTLPHYKLFRNHIDFKSIESDISSRAKTAVRDLYGQIAINPDEINLISLASEYGNAQQAVKGNTESEILEKLSDKLVLRRVALYCICKGVEVDNVCKLVMYGNTLTEITEQNKKQTIRGLHLKPETDIPYHILPEERAWLEIEMGIPIFQIRQQLDVTIDIVNQFINKKDNKALLSSVWNKLKLDNNGYLADLSINELKADLNKILKATYKTANGKKLMEELYEIAEKLIELMPEMKNPKELKSILDDFIEKGDKNDFRN